VTQARDVPVVLERVETPPELAASFERVTPEPNTAPLRNVYRVEVRLDAPQDVRRVQSWLALVTNLERLPERKVRVKAEVIGVQCIITPKVVVFGPDPPGAEVGRIEVATDRPFIISSAISSDGAVRANIGNPEPANSHVVVLRLSKDASPGDVIGKVRLVLVEDGLTESREVSFYGSVAAP
jgi:hypothetical protein